MRLFKRKEETEEVNITGAMNRAFSDLDIKPIYPRTWNDDMPAYSDMDCPEGMKCVNGNCVPDGTQEHHVVDQNGNRYIVSSDLGLMKGQMAYFDPRTGLCESYNPNAIIIRKV